MESCSPRIPTIIVKTYDTNYKIIRIYFIVRHFLLNQISFQVRSVITWPQHEYSLGGAYVLMDYENLGSGSCIVSLPKMVNLFHVSRKRNPFEVFL